MMAVLANRRKIQSVILISDTSAGNLNTVYGRQFHILEEQVRHVNRNYTIIRLNMLFETFFPPLLDYLARRRRLQCVLDPKALLCPIR